MNQLGKQGTLVRTRALTDGGLRRVFPERLFVLRPQKPLLRLRPEHRMVSYPAKSQYSGQMFFNIPRQCCSAIGVEPRNNLLVVAQVSRHVAPQHDQWTLRQPT